MDRSTIAARLVLAAALVGGVSYLAADYLMPAALSLAWKGSGVGLLAIYAALSARNADGWLICVVMAFGAAGDVLLGAAGVVAGGAAFLAGHLIAIVLYQRNRRPGLGWPHWIAAAVLITATDATAVLMPADRSAAPGVAFYGFGLAYMAASAALSRFPPSVAAGALMFLASDLLIFARAGPLAGAAWTGLAVWGLYFAGQALICTGVVRTLAIGRLT